MRTPPTNEQLAKLLTTLAERQRARIDTMKTHANTAQRARMALDEGLRGDARAARALEITQTYEKATEGLLGAAGADAREALAARRAWDPADYRARVALSDPVAAAAIRDRVALVPDGHLPTLAEQAREAEDWVLADAIGLRVGALLATTTPGTEQMDALEHASKSLSAMEVPGAEAALALVTEVSESAVVARYVDRAGVGRPLTGAEQIEVALQAPNVTFPELVGV